jgi:hypothetical protein
MQTGKGQAMLGGWPPRYGAPQQGLHSCTLVVYLGREGEQGTPYSSLTIHIVPPLACIRLGNIKHKSGLIYL